MKTINFFKGAMNISIILLMATSALAQNVGIEGGGSGELMEFIRRLVALVFYISLSGCLISLIIAGWKLSQGDGRGMDAVKQALIGTAIVAAATGFFKYFVFAAEETGVSGKGDLF